MGITEQHAVRRINQIIEIILSKTDIVDDPEFQGQHPELDSWHDLIVFYSGFLPAYVN